MAMVVQAEQVVRHGYSCIEAKQGRATVERGTPADGASWFDWRRKPLPTGTITFRDRTSKATIVTMPTTTGSWATLTNFANAEMVVGPDELVGIVQVSVVELGHSVVT